MATPSAEKQSMPTTMATTKAPTLSGKWTPKPTLPTTSSMTTSTAAMTIELKTMALSSAHVGRGVSLRRLSRPISRRLTRVMAKMLKQAAITP